MTSDTKHPAASAALLRILIVDDETIVRDSLGAWFRQDGHHVEVAESAKDALRMAAAGHTTSLSSTSRCPGWTASSCRRGWPRPTPS